MTPLHMRHGTDTDRASRVLTGLLLWLCSLPLVGLIVLPWLGPRVAVIVAVALLVFAVTSCYGICVWRETMPRRGGNDE